MNRTGIEWTAFSANPLKFRRKGDGKTVWGCVKTSPGCASCYSEAIALRFDRGKVFNATNMEELEPFLDETELRRMLTAKTVGGVPVDGSRVFVGDMTDVFGAWVPDALLDRLFAAFALRPSVTFQVLTKRAERMREYLSEPHLYQRLHEAVKHRMGYDHPRRPAINRADLPIRNVWLGVSVEDQQRADERIPHLLQTPAAVRFLSCEPLLSAVDLTRVTVPVPAKTERLACVAPAMQEWATRNGLPTRREAAVGLIPIHGHVRTLDVLGGRLETESGIVFDGPRVDWVIAGGESGPGARPMHPDWAGSIRDQCQAAGVAYFFKQWGEWAPGVDNPPPRCVARADGTVGMTAADVETSAEDLVMGRARLMTRVGKKRAGRLLDGRTHDEFPVPGPA